MLPTSMETPLRRRFAALAASLDERQRRLWAAAEARALGYGGVSLVSRATGVSRRAIHAGLAELRGPAPPPGRARRPGGGRKPLADRQPGLAAALDALAEPTSRGDPGSPLRYCCRSTRRLADALRGQGFRVGRQKVAELLGELGYSLQANRKTREGRQHPDRDAQFEFISARLREFQGDRQPAVSVDTKKKELLGDFANGGREWRRRGEPERVLVHDFASKGAGKAVPYGVFDVAAKGGGVSVGLSHEPAACGVDAARRPRGPAAGHGRRRRQQQLPGAAVEGEPAAAGRRGGLRRGGEPLPARDEQVEPGGARAVQLHRDELEGPAAARRGDAGGADP